VSPAESYLVFLVPLVCASPHPVCNAAIPPGMEAGFREKNTREAAGSPLGERPLWEILGIFLTFNHLVPLTPVLFPTPPLPVSTRLLQVFIMPLTPVSHNA